MKESFILDLFMRSRCKDSIFIKQKC